MLLMIHHTALALICTHLHWLPFSDLTHIMIKTSCAHCFSSYGESVSLSVAPILCKKSGWFNQISHNFLAALFK